MRSSRCTGCGKTFYRSDPSVTQCQDCTGTVPDKSAADAQEVESIRKANAATKTDTSQLLPIKELRKRKPRKNATTSPS